MLAKLAHNDEAYRAILVVCNGNTARNFLQKTNLTQAKPKMLKKQKKQVCNA